MWSGAWWLTSIGIDALHCRESHVFQPFLFDKRKQRDIRELSTIGPADGHVSVGEDFETIVLALTRGRCQRCRREWRRGNRLSGKR